MTKLFGTSGIRGVFKDDIDPSFAIHLSLAITKVFKPHHAIIGWDCRTSSEPLAFSLISGFLAGGVNVDIAGLVSTPSFQKYITDNPGKYSVGVMVTASHNPPEYNGFKVYYGDGLEIYPEDEDKIESSLYNKDYSISDWRRLGSTTDVRNRVLENYISSLVKASSISSNEYTIAIDLCGCSSILTIPPTLDRLKISYKAINDKIDGFFTQRLPEPKPDTIYNLIKLVKISKVNFGVAFDGDGDRSIFIDEKGVPWWGDATGILIGKYLIEIGETDSIVTPITSTAATEMVIESLGGKVIRTRVGGKNIVKAMINYGSKWGFEENGGGIYGPHLYGRDGGITLILIMNVLQHYNKPLSQLLEDIPKLFQLKEKVSIKNRLIIPDLLEHFSNYYSKYKIDRTEGVKVFFKDDEWVLIRPSGTEPIIRVFAESPNYKRAKDILNDTLKEIKDFLKSK
jgi:phosphomannomutase/phosphoglucomutase